MKPIRPLASISAVVAESRGNDWIFYPPNQEVLKTMRENFRGDWRGDVLRVDDRGAARVFGTLRDLGVRVKGVT